MRLGKKLIAALLISSISFVSLPAAATNGTWATPADVTVVGETAEDPQITVDSTGLATAVWSRNLNGGDNYVIRSSTSLNGGPWSSPVNVSTGDNLDTLPQVSVDSNGLVTAVWQRDDGLTNSIQSSSRARGGSWSLPVEISSGVDGNGGEPFVSVGSPGLATVVWRNYNGSFYVFESSSRSANGNWSAPRTISSPVRDASSVHVAVNSSGVEFAVWRSSDGPTSRVEYSSRVVNGSWTTPPVVISSLVNTYDPQIVVGSDGVVTVAWIGDNGNIPTLVQSIVRQSNGTFSGLQTHSSDNLLEASYLRLAADVSGSTTAVWLANSDGVANYTIQASSRTSEGISPAVDVSDISHSSYNPRLAINSDGFATATWQTYDDSNYIVASSTRLGGIWSNPANLSAAGQDASSPQVIVDGNGLSTVIWEFDGGPHNIIQSRTSLRGNAWSSTADLCALGRDSLTPEVAVDSNGLATLVYTSLENGFRILKARKSFRGGSWSAPVSLSTAGQSTYSPKIAVDSNGLATVVFETSPPGGNSAISATSSLRGGTWSNPVLLSPAGQDAYEPRIAVDGNGLATIVWLGNDGDRDLVQSSTSLNGGAWSNATTINNDASVESGNAAVAADSSGLAIAVWDSSIGTHSVIRSSKSMSGGTWSNPVTLSSAGSAASAPQVQINSGGIAIAVWQIYPDGIVWVIESSTSVGGGAWSSPEVISSTDQNFFNPTVALDSNGLAVFIWRAYGLNDVVIQSRTRSTNGTWSTVSNLSTAGQYAYNPQVVIDSGGRATVVWNASIGGGVIQSRTSLNGAAWSSTTNVSAPGGYPYGPKLAVDPTGLITSVWGNDAVSYETVQASSIQNTISSTATGYSNWGGSGENNSGDSSNSGQSYSNSPAPSPSPVLQLSPRPTKAPSVSGLAKVSRTLSVQKQIWVGSPTPKLTYKWYACSSSIGKAIQKMPRSCAAIKNASGTKLKLTRVHVGKFISLMVTGTSPGNIPVKWISKSTQKVTY